ncbi:MAG: hypothetical protein GWP61_07345 [Chloroflexi bacterium]|jgi:hypothetical protein|nr:hypothetical protein [Chloroflexota bacterium]
MEEQIRQQNKQKMLIIWLSGCLFVLTCLFILGAGTLAGLYLYTQDGGQLPLEMGSGAQPLTQLPPTPEPDIAPPTGAALATVPAMQPSETIASVPIATAMPSPSPEPLPTSPPSSKLALIVPPEINDDQIPQRAFEDLERLYEIDYPVHDYHDAADKLGGFEVGPRKFERPGFQIGDRRVFRTDEGRVEATLVEISEHAYFWVDDKLFLEETAVRSAAERLESDFYTRLTHLFGEAWNPGIDGDPRFSILHLAGSGDIYELGYFSDQDEYPQALFSDSNEQELVYLNMGQLEIGSDLYFGTLIHELQHLFQWNLDQNESTWLNEGLAQLAELYVGLDTALPDAYLLQPDTRLDAWQYDEDVIDAHYANSFLFSVYVWEQLGEGAIFELIRQPANGLTAVRKVLQGFQPDRSLEQFIADWTVANFVDDAVAGEHYGYTRLDLSEPFLETRFRRPLPKEASLEVNQLAAHYIDLDGSGSINLTFAGDTTAKLVDARPTSGEQMWYAPPANDTHAQLTAAFDLSQLEQATLEYNVWYDLEEDFDFGYISVSADQGETWRVISPQQWASGDYGPAYTGSSAGEEGSGWIQETIPLSSFAGQQILVRFHVLTDFEEVGRGFALDDIAIPELGYFADAETDDQRWQMDGFVRTGWLLPQRWAVQQIRKGVVPEVMTLELDTLNQFQGVIDLGPEGSTLVVVPLTPFVEESASYWLRATE